MTLTVDVRTPDGGTAGTVELDEAMFGIEPNVAVLHQAVTAQLAARRRGTHSTKTRAEVRGGGAKPWRQKGTGRARAGSIRSPQFTGGGIAHGPKPRSYRQKVNRKMVRLALCSALSDRARSERIMVIDEWRFAQPRTKDAVAALGNLSLEGRVLLVLEDSPADVAADRSFRNLPSVQIVAPAELNAYDILRSDWLVFTRDNLPATSQTPGDDAADIDDSDVEADVEDADVVDADVVEADVTDSDVEDADVVEADVVDSDVDDAVVDSDVADGDAQDDSSDEPRIVGQ